jgi:type II secretion system protein H
MARRAGQNGFTLIELLMVLVIISVFTGMIAVQMGGSQEAALLRSAGRKLMSAINFAGSQAITLNQTHIVTVDTTRSRYAVRSAAHSNGLDPEEKPAGPLEQGEFDAHISVTVRDLERNSEELAEPLQRGEPEAHPREEITFYPDGTADSRELILRDRSGSEMILRVNPATGRIRIVKPELEGPP